MNDPNIIDPSVSQSNVTVAADIFLYSDSKKSTSQNRNILRSTIKYIFAIKLFDELFC